MSHEANADVHIVNRILSAVQRGPPVVSVEQPVHLQHKVEDNNLMLLSPLTLLWRRTRIRNTCR